ncbi:hypothetical protein OEZ86_004561 [Tetradesmus obliquus]|nr:hypothetical protein OEZ86_004561 [Tetradesmus obliquus]
MNATCKASPSVTDWMQGVGNIVQAGISLCTAIATLLVAWYAYRVSQGQIRPLLSLAIENGKRHTQIQLLNNGLGPAVITKVTYKLRHETKPRVDIKKMDLRKQEDLDQAVADSVGEGGQPAGSRVYLLRHKEVHLPGEVDLTRARRRDLLDPVGQNTEQGTVAGKVLKAEGNIVLLRAEVKQDPAGIDNGPARTWLLLLRKMVNGTVITVEYTDARGAKMSKFIGVITMPAPDIEEAAADGADGVVQDPAGPAGAGSALGSALVAELPVAPVASSSSGCRLGAYPC